MSTASDGSSNSSALPTPKNWWLHIEIPSEMEKYTVLKRLDLDRGRQPHRRQLESNRCTIAIIPHTVEMTNLGSLKPGDPVILKPT